MNPARIMIVEDEAIIAMAIEQSLLEMGYAVAGIAHDADQALRLAAQSQPNLALMDIQLRGSVDGITVASQIGQLYRTPVVFLTAFSDEATLQRAKLTEPYSYLIKPFEARELRVAIEIALYRHQVQQKLRQAEHWLATTLRGMGEAVLSIDGRGALLYMNSIAEELTGWEFAAARLRPIEEICPLVHATTGQQIPSLLQRTEREGFIIEEASTVELLRRDGDRIPVHLSAAPLRDEADQVIGVGLVLRRDSERLELETRYRQLQKMEAVGQLAAGMAHDFNNMLAVISGHCELLQMDSDMKESSRHEVRMIGEACRRAETLTRQMLSLSRRHVARTDALDMNQLVDRIRQMLDRVLGSRINIHFHPSQRPPWVTGEASMLEQVIVNLAINARDAMPLGGELTITLEVVEIAPPHQIQPSAHVRLALADTGLGIPEEIRPRVFEPFFTTKQEAGTGLGLASAASIVQQHQGWIAIDPTYQSTGTRFVIHLPLAAPPPELETPHPERAPMGDEAILLVEDDPGLRPFARGVLERAGYAVVEAANGPEALALWEARAGKFGLLLTSLLPTRAMVARELVRLLRGLKPDLKVIYASGYEPDNLGPEFTLQPGLNFLKKPYTTQELLCCVVNSLG